jgi:hypothetical protein
MLPDLGPNWLAAIMGTGIVADAGASRLESPKAYDM